MSSTTIDSKVVEMKFDNKDFEANIKNSLSTLDKLKDKLSFKGATTGLESVAKASSRIDFSTMSDGLDYATLQFSSLQVAGITAIQNITNSLMSLGTSIVNTFAIQPITSGFAEYELKMGSVQTIMASTGASIDEINGYLDDLNKYSDETIYSFADMTNNIGKFTNAGVDLETAVKAIQGVSNEAAVSGASANEASRAMYNFAQALSAGYVKLIDWKSIENANMATKEFKQELINTAAELGTLEQQADGTYKVLTSSSTGSTMDEAITSVTNFNDSLQYQWMTTDVLTTTLARYADETTEIGQKAFAAAKDVKTFSMMMDTLEESAGSGWATTFELIWGNFEEAKSFWTKLTDQLQPFIDMMSDSRNNLLEGIMQGVGDTSSWSQISTQITDAGITLEKFKEGVVAAGNASGVSVQEIIDSTGSLENAFKSGKLSTDLLTQGLEQLANGVGDLGEVGRKSASELKDTISSSTDLLDAMTKLSTNTSGWSGSDYWSDISEHIEWACGSIDKFQKAVVAVGDASGLETTKIIEDAGGLKEAFTSGKLEANLITKALRHMVTNMGDLTGDQRTSLNLLNAQLSSTDEWREHLTDLSGRGYFTGAILNVVTAIKNIVQTIGSAWNEAFASTDTVQYFHNVLKGIYGITNSFLTWTTERADALKRTFKGLFSVVQLAIWAIRSVATFIAQTLGKAFSLASFDILDFTAMIGDVISSVVEFIEESTLMSTILPIIGDAFLAILDTLNDFKNYILNVLDSFGLLETAQSIVDALCGGMGNLTDSTEGVRTAIRNAADTVYNFVQNVKQWIAQNELLQMGIRLVQQALVSVKEKAKEIFKYIQTTVKEFIKSYQDNELLTKAKDSLKELSTELTNAGNSAMAAGKSVSDCAKDIGSAFQSWLGNFDLSAIFNNIVSQVKNFGTSIIETFNGIFKTTNTSISNIGDLMQNIDWSPIIAIAGAGSVIWTLNKIAKSAASISTAVKTALSPFEALNTIASAFKDTMKSLSGVLNAAKLPVYGVALMELAISVGILAAAIYALGSMDPGALQQGLEAFGGVVAALAVLMAAAAGLGDNANAISGLRTALVFLGVLALFAIAGAAVVYALGGMDTGQMAQGLIGLAVIIALVCGAAIAASRWTGDGAEAKLQSMAIFVAALGVTMVLIAAACAILNTVSSDSIGYGITLMTLFMVLCAVVIEVGKTAKPESMTAIGTLAAALGAAVLLISVAVAILGRMSEEEISQGVSVIDGFILLIMAMVYGLKGKETQLVGVASTLIATSVALILMVAVCKLAAMLTPEEIASGVVFMGIFGTLIALFIKFASSNNEKQIAKCGVQLLAVAVVMIAMVAICLLCSQLSKEAIVKGTVVVTDIGVLMTAMIKALAGNNKRGISSAYKSILMLGVVCGILTACIVILGSMDTGAVAQGTIAISAVMVAFRIMLEGIKGCDKIGIKSAGISVGLLAALVLLIAGLVGMVAAINSKYPVSLEAMAGVALLAIGMSAACVLLGIAGEHGAAAFVGLGVLAALFVGGGALFALVGAINQLSNGGLAECINNSLPVLNAFGGALGEFIGSFVGHVFSAWSDALPTMADNLNSFVEKMQGIGAALSADGSGINIDQIEQLCKAILMITAADLLANITSFLGWSNNNDDLSNKFEQYGKAVNSFIDGVGNVSSGQATNAANAAKAVAEIATAFPSEGGLASSIFGDKSTTISNMAANLPSFGSAIVKFVDSISGLGEDSLSRISNSVDAAKSIAEIMQIEWPKEGGLWSMVTGQQTTTISNLSSTLEPLADGIVTFANKVAELNTSGVDPAVAGLRSIAELIKDESIKNVLVDPPNTLKFTVRIDQLATSIVSFAQTLGETSFENIGSAVTALREVASFLINDLNGEIDTANVDNFKTATDTLATINVAAIAKQFTNGASQMTAAGMTLITGLANGLTAGTEACTTAANSVVTAIQNAASGMSSNFNSVGTDITTAIAAGVNAGVINVTGAISAVITKTNQQGAVAAVCMRSIGTAGMNAVADGIRNSVSIISGAISSVLSSATTGWSDTGYSKFYHIGYWCGEGLVDGLNSRLEKVQEAAGALGDAAAEATSKATEVNSPSKVFARIGNWCGVGLANGLNAQTNSVAKAGASLGNAVIGSASDSLALLNRMEASTSGFTTLTPVMDYSNIGNYGKTLDLSASIGDVITQPMKSSTELFGEAQKAIDASNTSMSQKLDTITNWLESELGAVISNNSPNLVIDNDAGKLIVDNRLTQLKRKAAMNRG